MRNRIRAARATAGSCSDWWKILYCSDQQVEICLQTVTVRLKRCGYNANSKNVFFNHGHAQTVFALLPVNWNGDVLDDRDAVLGSGGLY